MTITALIVDDEQDIRALIRVVIQSAKSGLVVDGEAADADEAIARIEAHNPDVIILDQRMPGMTGMDLARIILSRWPDQKIVLCSAYLDADIRREAEMVGIMLCLAKGEIGRIPQVMHDLAGAE